ncbi:CLUMA_CG001479, isoform A [Clunio marinus]|uniref:CLUMA_CG001479, isoform A n=1 Tax=Clunio marinus TaxID=568069 RepID=A0A1J1HI20_9DIPT|nr:CLUMA_CG001479, isoform A [Clunio marinus]
MNLNIIAKFVLLQQLQQSLNFNVAFISFLTTKIYLPLHEMITYGFSMQEAFSKHKQTKGHCFIM